MLGRKQLALQAEALQRLRHRLQAGAVGRRGLEQALGFGKEGGHGRMAPAGHIMAGRQGGGGMGAFMRRL